jgi:hypothetical protein
MDALQVKLFEEANAEDLAAAEQRLAQLAIKPAATAPKSRPTRQRLPASLPRVDTPTNPRTPPALVVRPCSVSVRMSPSGWTMCPACFGWSVISVGCGPASAARICVNKPCPRRSLSRASLPPDCWHRC